MEIKGQVERITYSNEENGYVIAKVRVPGRHDLITVVGSLFAITPGEVLRLSGHWDYHPKYGEQLKVTSYDLIMPATARGIERYLGSGMIKGIGPIMAKRLVAVFGEKTLDIIEESIERILQVPGIGEKRVEMISQAWREHREIRDVMVFLQGQGVSPAYAVKIYKHYRNDAIKVVKENPYRLATDIFGIGFITADKIAEKLGISKESPLRTEAGILYVLHQLSEDGHMYYPYDALVTQCAGVLKVEESVVPCAIESVASQKKIVIEDMGSPGSRLSRPEGEFQRAPSKAVFLTPLHVAEVGIVNKMRELFSYPKQMRLINIDEAIGWAQKVLNMTLSEKQEEAVRASVHAKAMIVTGGPGTGKTTIINTIIKIYGKMGQKVLLAAPTGRAAKRMTEATGHEAKTIHRLLEFSPGGTTFKKNEKDPLEADLIIIDEASMVDTVLMYHFLKAVSPKATVILVGDVDQLPSVGPGAVLKDIIDSGFLPTVRLKEIFRQSKESMIIVNAHRINSGHMPTTFPDDKRKRDFYFLAIEEPERVLQEIVTLCKERIPSRFGYDPFNDIQVLTPMHKGTVGVTSLNATLQSQLNPHGRELIRSGRVLRTGDKVIQMKNNYNKDVFNGDIGRIGAIDQEMQEVLIDFDGRRVAYEFPELDEITLAYAISVHKSQGSEYPVVIMPVLTQHYMLLQRNLIYTAVTRGKRLVILIGTWKALAIAVKNNTPQKRYTMLKERLRGQS